MIVDPKKIEEIRIKLTRLVRSQIYELNELNKATEITPKLAENIDKALSKLTDNVSYYCDELWELLWKPVMSYRAYLHHGDKE